MPSYSELTAEEIHEGLDVIITKIETLAKDIKQYTKNENQVPPSLHKSMQKMYLYLLSEKGILEEQLKKITNEANQIDYKVLDKKLEKALLEGAHEVKDKFSYNHPYAVQHMIKEYGATATVQKLISQPISSGYTDLVEAGALNLTVEYIVYSNSEFHDLFSEQEMKVIKVRAKSLNIK